MPPKRKDFPTYNHKNRGVHEYRLAGLLAAENETLALIEPGYDIRLTEDGDIWTLEDGTDWALE